MNKIDFVNGQPPYINGLNLNKMQDNIEDAINEILESGSNDNGNWIKYADGTMIVTQKFTRTISINNPAGALYYVSTYDIPAYPVNFKEVHSVNVTAYNNNICSALPYSDNKELGSHLDQCCTRLMIYAPELFENETILFNVTTIGRWK